MILFIQKKASRFGVIVFVLFLFTLFSPYTFQAQTKPKAKTDTQKTSYSINGKAVNKIEFDKLYHSLIEVKGTWYCAETDEGGKTGFDGKTKNGTVYEYKMISKKNQNIASLDKIK